MAWGLGNGIDWDGQNPSIRWEVVSMLSLDVFPVLNNDCCYFILALLTMHVASMWITTVLPRGRKREADTMLQIVGVWCDLLSCCSSNRCFVQDVMAFFFLRWRTCEEDVSGFRAMCSLLRRNHWTSSFRDHRKMSGFEHFEGTQSPSCLSLYGESTHQGNSYCSLW